MVDVIEGLLFKLCFILNNLHLNVKPIPDSLIGKTFKYVWNRSVVNLVFQL